MESTKQINIKDCTYYFYNHIIDIKTFDPNMLRLDKKKYKNLDIFNIGYVTVKNIISSGHSINSVNPLYLRIDNASGYIKENWTDKCLIFDSTDENKELLKEYNIFDGLIEEIRNIDDDWLERTKDYMKIKFNSDDNLPQNKPLKFYNMTVTIRCVTSEENKLYPQVFLDDTLYSF